VIAPARTIADMQAAAAIAGNLIGLGQTGLAQQVIGGAKFRKMIRPTTSAGMAVHAMLRRMSQ
jgi:hypothetical protein